jgi:hypothetical protein
MHHGTELILARRRAHFHKTKVPIEEDFFGCTTLGEEWNRALLFGITESVDVVSRYNFIARFPPFRYTWKLLPHYQNSEFSQQETLSCRSAHSNPTAAAARRSTAFSFAWPPKPEPLC